MVQKRDARRCSRSWIAACALIGVSFVVGACGDSESTQPVATMTTTTASPSNAGSASPTTDSPDLTRLSTTVAPVTTALTTSSAAVTTVDIEVDSTASVLQRRDPPPAAVAAQIDSFEAGNGGDGACLEYAELGLAIVPQGWGEAGADVTTVGGALSFCMPGFDPALPIVVSTESPSGVTTTEELRSLDEQNAGATGTERDGANYYFWNSFPTDELGTYVIEARQADLLVSSTFEVIDAELPTVDARPRAAPPGTVFTIGVAGYEALDEAVLYVYRIDPDDPETRVHHESLFAGRYDYITTIRVATDETGRGSYRIETTDRDLPGGYGFTGEPPQERTVMPWYFWDAEFIVERAA